MSARSTLAYGASWEIYEDCFDESLGIEFGISGLTVTIDLPEAAVQAICAHVKRREREAQESEEADVEKLRK